MKRAMVYVPECEERVIEIAGDGKGLLLSLAVRDGILVVEPYRMDPDVIVVPTPRVPEWTTMEQIRRANPNWFSQGASRFFGSRVGQKVFTGGFFVSSERCSAEHQRLYTVRRATRDKDGNPAIRTMGEFQAHKTMRSAVRAAMAVSAEWQKGKIN